MYYEIKGYFVSFSTGFKSRFWPQFNTLDPYPTLSYVRTKYGGADPYNNSSHLPDVWCFNKLWQILPTYFKYI